MRSKNKFAFWHWPTDQLFLHLRSRQGGLTSQEATYRLHHYGLNLLKPPKQGRGLVLFLSQFKSPLILLLLGAAILSVSLGGRTDATIILAIVILSGVLGFFQERGALNALEELLRAVENKTAVLRDGKEVELSNEKIVPGDIVVLRAGDLVPADCVLLESTHLFVNEASLTGESSPVEKRPGPSPLERPHLERTNSLFLGTMVASGCGTAIVVATGQGTEYSHLVEQIRFRPPETAFELGVRKFGFFLLQVTLVIVIFIFAVNVYLQKPFIESLLFALAIAVGLTPQLLPAIISVNLSHGARQMAAKKVIVRRLPSIENFGQMNVLCTDKTGTITTGKLELATAVGIDGSPSDKASLYGFLNAHFQGGYTNPLDQAILAHATHSAADWEKIDEIPYDFIRKRLSIVVRKQGQTLLISKGAVPQILSLCDQVELSDGTLAPFAEHKERIDAYFEEKSRSGFRTLSLAYGSSSEEEHLTFLGFLHFTDPIKPDTVEVISELKKKGVHLKILTGDHSSVAAQVATQLGIHHTFLISGEELKTVSDEALHKIVYQKNIFAQLEPNQKERIILSLRQAGNVVGYLGDGINDVSALHSADVGIAVDSGADAAKEAADIILLEKELSVLRVGIEEGRRTFINTMKYVYMATSANFGNMFSMAGISLFLPFLPLLPKQVLLTNFFSDLPEMALATDRVDSERIEKPVKWDFHVIRRFMVLFGLLNSLADYATFAFLFFYFHADQTLFQSGWFVENVVSAVLVVLAIRTRRFLFSSKPSSPLILAVLIVAIGTLFLPYTSFGALFGLAPIPLALYLMIGSITLVYIALVEVAKRLFFRSLH
ncbi:MAG: magnesium-translocating P-type ATPase [Verrucomicrobiota bacterium]|nr:magnesium-translocating P-type ATPase [Verrucomicrobiota bacterium]